MTRNNEPINEQQPTENTEGFFREVEIEFRDNKLEKLSESTQNSLSLDIYSSHRYSSQQ